MDEQTIFEGFKSYIIQTLNFDDFLSKFDFDLEYATHGPPVKYFLLSFFSQEDVRSKFLKRTAVLDVKIYYTWMDTFTDPHKDGSIFSQKGKTVIAINYYNEDSEDDTGIYYSFISDVWLDKTSLTEAIKSLKAYLKDDIEFLGDDDEDDEAPAPVAPVGPAVLIEA